MKKTRNIQLQINGINPIYLTTFLIGAVVAREYGLPCLVGVQNVKKHFKTGRTE